ncbi:MAG: acyl carrier protein [Lachnospiraceae bacterium]|nr:acyl carrier protein [Lachnospiraceae bacterium]
MFDKVRDILAEQLRLDPDKITPNAEIIADLGADSLDVLQLLMTIEDEYGVKIPDEELENFHTVGDIVEYVEANFEE